MKTMASHLDDCEGKTAPGGTFLPPDSNASDAKNHREILEEEKPSIFKYVDYRLFLQAAFAHKKKINSNYTESAFIQQAGLGKNSRGYLSMVIKGKRNLSAKSIYGFVQALKLTPKETIYFENLVFFNQSKEQKERIYYFEKLEVAAEGMKSSVFEILRAQYHYVSKWYLIAIRELVAFKDFKESPTYITKKLRNKVSKRVVEDSIEHLVRLGLLCRDSKGKLVQSEPIVNFSDNANNFKDVISIHQQFLDKAKEALEEDDYQDRSVRSASIACPKIYFDDMRAEIKEFMDKLLIKYGGKDEPADALFQVGMQLFHLSELKK